ncbi:MAG: hypothetical protein II561_07800 [Thermoguttaceae bacterium]|nr:hypothetical protein [Thermoguttaceae bacterium]MBQ2556441.1 hypothetical protein [Thermoguttaceae bacterium]
MNRKEYLKEKITQIEELSLSAIKPYEKNPCKNDGAVNGVAESIKQFRFQQPIANVRYD